MENELNTIERDELRRQQKKTSRAFNIYDWAGTAIFSLVMIVTLFTLVFRIVGVDGDSMMQTLQNGDRLILTSSLGYEPQYGDIVVIARDNKEPLVKRVIATEGQRVEITVDGKVLVDGVEKTDYAYYSNPQKGTEQKEVTIPQIVPKDCVFVLGDNRQNSHDSRSSDIGFVRIDSIVGKAVYRLFPLESMGKLYE